MPTKRDSATPPFSFLQFHLTSSSRLVPSRRAYRKPVVRLCYLAASISKQHGDDDGLLSRTSASDCLRRQGRRSLCSSCALAGRHRRRIAGVHSVSPFILLKEAERRRAKQMLALPSRRADPEKSITERLIRIWQERGDFSQLTAAKIRAGEVESVEEEEDARPSAQDMRELQGQMMEQLS